MKKKPKARAPPQRSPDRYAMELRDLCARYEALGMLKARGEMLEILSDMARERDYKVIRRWDMPTILEVSRRVERRKP